MPTQNHILLKDKRGGTALLSTEWYGQQPPHIHSRVEICSVLKIAHHEGFPKATKNRSGLAH